MMIARIRLLDDATLNMTEEVLAHEPSAVKLGRLILKFSLIMIAKEKWKIPSMLTNFKK